LNDDQTPLQRIVWRNNPAEAIKIYKFLTLTYGLAPVSFLATKMIQQLADLEGNQFSISAMIAKRDFYMDDLITGANLIKEAITIHDQPCY